MRVALVAEAFQARTSFDSDSHVRTLAPAMARAGAEVEVFAGVRGSGIPPYCQRRFEVNDHVGSSVFGVTSVELEGAADPDRVAAAFGAFLDRERPDVCHFEHLHAFGVGLVREAKLRGIATLYCAADTWPAHDRTTLTLPDLSPFELGDADAEARAIAAEALVATSGPCADDAEGRRAALSAWLHGPMNRAQEVAALRDAREAIEARRAEKRVALSAVDRRFASSRLLSKELSAAVGRAFTFRAPGVDTALISAAEAPGLQDSSVTAPRSRAARYVFVGTTRPTAGVDVLLDAMATLRAAELEAGPGGDSTESSAGDSGKDDPTASAGSASSGGLHVQLLLRRTDADRDAQIAGRAAALGVDVTFENEATASLAGAVVTAITGADALVLPSLWGEVAPSLARLALAAGRPVIASRMPGVLEAVPQAAGIFVPPADAQALASALKQFAQGGATEKADDGAGSAPRQEHATTLGARGIQAGGAKSVDDEVAEWLDTYRQMVATFSASTAARERSSLRAPEAELENLADVKAQFHELQGLSVSELFTRAQEGLGQLRKAFGVQASDAELLSRVVARGGVARDRAEQDERIREDVARGLGDLRAARLAMRAEEESRAKRVADLQAVLSAYEQEVLARGAAATQSAQDLESSRELTEELSEQVSTLRAERDALEIESRAAAERADAVAAQADKARSSLAGVEHERQQMAEAIELREAEIDRLRERVGRAASSTKVDEVPRETDDLETIEAYCSALEREVESLQRHDEWVQGEASRLASRLAAAVGDPTGGPAGTPSGAPSGAPSGEGPAEPAQSKDRPSDLAADLERGAASLQALTQELDWRRREMQAARAASDSLRARFLVSPLAARVRRWDEGPPAAPMGEASAPAKDGPREEAIRDGNGPPPALPRPSAATEAESEQNTAASRQGDE